MAVVSDLLIHGDVELLDDSNRLVVRITRDGNDIVPRGLQSLLLLSTQQTV
jgi:hypothetical protein